MKARAAGLSLSDRDVARFETHRRLLKKWGRRMNLTALEDDEAIVNRHFLEPIAVSDLLEEHGTLVDLGSGNGFPAVPLKVMHPGLELVLVEASEKKSAFLWAVIREIGLEKARVETRRVEKLGDLADLLPCRYLTLRAIRTGSLFKGASMPILRSGGKALFFVTRDQAETLRVRPIPGLRFSGARQLPSDSKSVVAIFGPGGA
jgi:16S rRNA (guanine527-N7)-methyltransferase